MTVLFKPIVLLALSLPLMAATCEETLRTNLTKTCNALASAYAHYDAVAASGAISVSAMQHVANVRAQTDDICTSPETATTITLTAAAARAYVALSAAYKQGMPHKDAIVGYEKLENLRVFLENQKRNAR